MKFGRADSSNLKDHKARRRMEAFVCVNTLLWWQWGVRGGFTLGLEEEE